MNLCAKLRVPRSSSASPSLCSGWTDVNTCSVPALDLKVKFSISVNITYINKIELFNMTPRSPKHSQSPVKDHSLLPMSYLFERKNYGKKNLKVVFT